MPELHDVIDREMREELAAYDDLTAALLHRRGVQTRDEAAAFLAPNYDEHIHDPLLLKNMPEAAERLRSAIKNGEHIAIWSDYDCDGIPGGVILHDFLKKVGANFENYIPHRHEEGYGVNVDGIEKLANNGAKLMITVDSGITDVAAIAHAKKLGMDVIVTDHHLPQEGKLPDAIIVDHKQGGETYPFQDLCGAAMAWKLVCATLAVAPELREKVPQGWEKWLLDMAGLATIADMVSLTGENRVIAHYGLIVMRKSPRIGLQKLCKVMRVNQRFISEDDVAFMLAPRVNAASRMGDPRDAFTLFTTDDEALAEELAKKLEAANRGRRAAAAAITRGVHAKMTERMAARNGALPSVIALGDPDWKPALLGLVASSIAEEYERPVFLWGREGNQTLKGSCRSYGNVHLVELMTAAKDVFAQFGGHAYSGGFTVKSDQVFFLEEQLAKARDASVHVSVTEQIQADATLTPDEATYELMKKLARLAPFGEGNPKPVFLFRDVYISVVTWFGKSSEHLKLSVATEFSDPIDAVAFYAKRELGKRVERLESGKRATLFASLERDQFSRKRVPRLRIVSLG
ncbi:MAG TPA: single-stranded-DNA-specific exonuclease RecJ [Candidatus Paceibacterota bacterium]|nr:single-stranded-DNA-specific exonuclease RecJ [Candidatus Paceibacterota bacterium]